MLKIARVRGLLVCLKKLGKFAFYFFLRIVGLCRYLRYEATMVPAYMLQYRMNRFSDSLMGTVYH